MIEHVLINVQMNERTESVTSSDLILVPVVQVRRGGEERKRGGMMDKMRRILVYVCKDGAAQQRAQFVQVSLNQLTHTHTSD